MKSYYNAVLVFLVSFLKCTTICLQVTVYNAIVHVLNQLTIKWKLKTDNWHSLPKN